jgi:hypothetical protein
MWHLYTCNMTRFLPIWILQKAKTCVYNYGTIYLFIYWERTAHSDAALGPPSCSAPIMTLPSPPCQLNSLISSGSEKHMFVQSGYIIVSYTLQESGSCYLCCSLWFTAYPSKSLILYYYMYYCSYLCMPELAPWTCIGGCLTIRASVP